MKLIIDSNVCAKCHLTIDEALIIAFFDASKNYSFSINNLVNRGIIKKMGTRYIVTDDWKSNVLKCISQEKEDKFFSLAKQIRELFPAGKQQCRYGKVSPYYYRSNTNEIASKLKKFAEKYGEYSDEEILDATKRYVASFNGNYINMRLAKYFIYKEDKRQSEAGTGYIEEISELATFLENKDNEELVQKNDDWLLTVRN